MMRRQTAFKETAADQDPFAFSDYGKRPVPEEQSGRTPVKWPLSKGLQGLLYHGLHRDVVHQARPGHGPDHRWFWGTLLSRLQGWSDGGDTRRRGMFVCQQTILQVRDCRRSNLSARCWTFICVAPQVSSVFANGCVHPTKGCLCLQNYFWCSSKTLL